jgi:hypothetical protein
MGLPISAATTQTATDGLPGVGRQAGNAQRQAGPDLKVAVGQLVEPAPLIGQALGQPLERPVWTGGQARAGDPDRQGQAAAQLGDAPRRRRFGRGALGPDDPAQQGGRRRRAPGIQLDQHAPGDPGQAGAAGDDDGTGRLARQQRPDRLGAAGVVEHHEHPPAGQA